MIQSLNAIGETVELNQDQPEFLAQAKRTHALLAHEGKIWNELSEDERNAIADQELVGLNVVPITTPPLYFHPDSYEALKRIVPDLKQPESAIKKLLKK